MSTCRDFNTASFLARAGGGHKPGNVRYWHIADIGSCDECPLLGVKRTCVAPQMSANDPKRDRPVAPHKWLRRRGSLGERAVACHSNLKTPRAS